MSWYYNSQVSAGNVIYMQGSEINDSKNEITLFFDATPNEAWGTLQVCNEHWFYPIASPQGEWKVDVDEFKKAFPNVYDEKEISERGLVVTHRWARGGTEFTVSLGL